MVLNSKRVVDRIPTLQYFLRRACMGIGLLSNSSIPHCTRNGGITNTENKHNIWESYFIEAVYFKHNPTICISIAILYGKMLVASQHRITLPLHLLVRVKMLRSQSCLLDKYDHDIPEYVYHIFHYRTFEATIHKHYSNKLVPFDIYIEIL